MIEVLLSGSGRERGLSLGRSYPQLILERIDRFAHRTPAEDEIAHKLWAEFHIALPDYADEIIGIASGAHASVMDVFALTADEIFHGRSTWFEACTNLASTHGDPLIAKTSDGDALMQRYLCVMRSAPVGGLRSVRAAYLGAVGVSIGVNEAGVGYAGASLPSAEAPKRGIPVMAIVANALDHATSADHAAALVQQFEVTGHGFQAMWVDTTGAIRRNESLPGSSLTQAPSEDWVVHTNWPLMADSLSFASATREFTQNSLQRLNVAHDWARRVTELDIADLLRTHGPGGLCQHGSEDLYTVFGGIALANQRALVMSSGPPCANPFVRFELERKN